MEKQSKFHVQSIGSPLPVWNEIKSWMTDDAGGLETEGNFLGVFDGETMAGAFLIKPWSEFCYEIHGGVHPDYWGQGKQICLTLGWGLFQSTPCLKIVAIIPEFNRLMRKCVKAAGLKKEGVISKAYVKNMKAHDLYIYGISRGDGFKFTPQSNSIF